MEQVLLVNTAVVNLNNMQSGSYLLPFSLIRLRTEVSGTDFPIPSLYYRGEFGKTLLQSVCRNKVTHKAPACDCCNYKSNCSYTSVFKPAVLTQRHLPDSLPALVFNTSAERGHLYLEVSVFLTDTDSIQSVSDTLQSLSSRPDRKVEVEERLGSRCWRPAGEAAILPQRRVQIPAAPDQIQIQFLTPTRVRKKGHWLSADEFEAGDFIHTLFRRMKNITYEYGLPVNWNFERLAEDCRGLIFDQKTLCWADASRSTVKKKVEHSGLVGNVTFTLANYPEFWPLIWAGQFINLGKGAAHGLGRYQVSALTSL